MQAKKHQQRWSFENAQEIFEKPFLELVYEAQRVHHAHFKANEIQISVLLSIKTGGCPENCAYCPQSSHYATGLRKEPLMSLESVLEAAQSAKAQGATRFCMGAAWRSPRDEDLTKVAAMITEVKKLGLETCVTLGMLEEAQAHRLKAAGLDFYNHNIDTSESFYDKIITSRVFADRLQTLACVQKAGLQVCCGGIIGMGEANEDRIQMLVLLANLEVPPQSVPINKLIPIPGTPLAEAQSLDPLDFIRTIALARILMPTSFVRLSAGRESMSDEMQALCFMAGANSMFYGEKLLTMHNPLPNKDEALLSRLGLKKMIFPRH